LKIRIFALAKELGLDSKDLIQKCNDAGLNVKSSALASITPAERDVLMQHLESAKTGAAPAAETPVEDPMRPVREVEGSRTMRNIVPDADTKKSRRGPRKPSAVPLDEVEAPEVVAETEDSTGTVEPVVEATEAEVSPEISETDEAVAPIEKETVEQTANDEKETPAADDEADTDDVAAESSNDDDEAASDESGGDDAPSGTSPGSPMSRDEYIAPTGNTAASLREMKPVGSVRERAARREKKKAPVGPALATPSFKAPAAKKSDEGPVQKPDLALTGDILKNNKLKSLIDQNRTGKDKKSDESKSAKRGDRSMGLEESRNRRRNRRQRSDDDGSRMRRGHKRQKRATGPIVRATEATVTAPISVRSLSEAMGRPAKDLITVLFKQGTIVNINDMLEDDVALEIALELDVDLEIVPETDFEDSLTERLDRTDEDFEAELVRRPPIITVLGHVDHGKTTLVDRIRSANVVDGEAGGITQHIAAYQVGKGEERLTFVDTPGHAAFGEMRARGANVTDIIVLVVAADDGVMPQTIECIAHAKAAGVPIVVAMNKCDLPDINEQRVLTELSQHGILPQEWGGEVEVVRVSALAGTGVDDLLETLNLTAEIHELKTVADVPAEGVCLEAFRDEGRGPIAWSIIRRGTLRVGDIVLCGGAFGRVRAMYNDRDEELQEAGPSTPVKITGFNDVPGAGDRLFVMDDIEDAREYAEQRQFRGRSAVLADRGGPVSLEDFFKIRDGEIKDLPLIIKADTPGSLEAIKGELDKFEHDEVRIKILHQGVGGVNESDVYLAASSGAVVIAFHVIAEDRAELLASQEGVEIRRYKIIYNVIDDIRQALEGLLIPEKVEISTGRALVLRTFSISKTGTIAGCRVLNGTIGRNSRVHVIRDQTILNNYSIGSLRREKDDAKEVREGFECGIRLDGFNDVKEGDLLEAYRIEERQRSLDE